MKIFNPATTALLANVTEDNVNTITQKYLSLQQGQPVWQQEKLPDKLLRIKKFRQLLLTNIDMLALTLSQEVGKPLTQARNEIHGAVTRIDYFLAQAQQVIGDVLVHQSEEVSEILSYEPLGIIANISAWNYPYLVGVNVFIPALLCGNAVLYKPSEFATLTGQHIADLLHQAGIPTNVFSLVCGDGKVGEQLLALDLDGYFFTGSYQTGQYIAQRVSDKLVPVGLELGGKDPLYVTDEANLTIAAQGVVDGAFYNNGQSCCAVERVYVHEKIYEQFVALVLAYTEKLIVGDPLKPATTNGAITRFNHLEFLHAQVQDACDKGAKLLVGGKQLISQGHYFPPTILTDVNHTMTLMTDETFGPLIGLQKVNDDQTAIQLMNDTDYGLTASVYSDNIIRAKNLLKKVNTGNSYINCCDRVSVNLPWAGRKHSGLGATLSIHGFYAFCQTKGLHIIGSDSTVFN